MHKAVIYKVRVLTLLMTGGVCFGRKNHLHNQFCIPSVFSPGGDVQSFPHVKMMEMSVVNNSKIDIFIVSN